MQGIDVYDECVRDLPPGAQVTACIVIVEYLDFDTNERFLVQCRDTEAGIWTHIGMLSAARNRAGAIMANGYDQEP